MNLDIDDKASCFACEKHNGQLDDEGFNYFIAHLNKVANAVACLTNDKEVIAAAYLHDIIEDTNVTYEDLVTLFNKRVADLVHEVTDEGEKDNYGKYFPRLKSAEAIMIKLCDRASNISRMGSWDENRKAQYLKKTKFWKNGSDRK